MIFVDLGFAKKDLYLLFLGRNSHGHISYNKKDQGSHAFGAHFQRQDACRLTSLALRLSVRRFHGRSHPLFLFSARGGHAMVASSVFCVWLHALAVHKLRHGGHA
jgi:hypothetical protein